MGASGSVLMHIRVPRGCERQVQVIGERRAKHAVFAGSGDVDNVRMECLQRANDQRQVADKSRVEGEAFVEVEGQKAAAQLEGMELLFNEQARPAISGAYAEKGQRMAARKCFKVAAGMGNTVDFVERVGKKGDPRGQCTHRDSHYE